jgi:hypothetical protein
LNNDGTELQMLKQALNYMSIDYPVVGSAADGLFFVLQHFIFWRRPREGYVLVMPSCWEFIFVMPSWQVVLAS